MVQHQQEQQGFTLIEVLVVIAIVLVLLALSVQSFQYFANSSGSDASARRIAKQLEEAHARTLASDDDTTYGVHFATSSVTLFPGTLYIAGNSENKVLMLRKAEISSIDLSGGVQEVYFSRLRGSASASGTVTVIQTTDEALERTIHIYDSGLIDIER